MELQKMLNLLNEASDSKFVTRKRKIVNDRSNAIYCVGNEIIYNTGVLKSNLCDFNYDYILVAGGIFTPAHNISIQETFKNCSPFIKCIKKWWKNNRWYYKIQQKF